MATPAGVQRDVGRRGEERVHESMAALQESRFKISRRVTSAAWTHSEGDPVVARKAVMIDRCYLVNLLTMLTRAAVAGS